MLNRSNGHVLKSFHVGTVWAGPSISRGRIYVGSGSILFFKKQYEGMLYSYGLPGQDAVDKLGEGNE